MLEVFIGFTVYMWAAFAMMILIDEYNIVMPYWIMWCWYKIEGFVSSSIEIITRKGHGKHRE